MSCLTIQASCSMKENTRNKQEKSLWAFHQPEACSHQRGRPQVKRNMAGSEAKILPRWATTIRTSFNLTATTLIQKAKALSPHLPNPRNLKRYLLPSMTTRVPIIATPRIQKIPRRQGRKPRERQRRKRLSRLKLKKRKQINRQPQFQVG